MVRKDTRSPRGRRDKLPFLQSGVASCPCMCVLYVCVLCVLRVQVLCVCMFCICVVLCARVCCVYVCVVCVFNRSNGMYLYLIIVLIFNFVVTTHVEHFFHVRICYLYSFF